jgi:MFS family permease
MTLLVTITLVMLGAGAVNALDVYFVQENLHAAPAWFGVIGAAFGVGALLGSALAGSLGDRFGHAKVFCAALLLAAGLFLVYSRMASIWTGLAAVVLFSIGLGGLNTASMPLIVRSVPRSHLGRVLSVFGPTEQVATIFSIAVAGSLVGVLPRSFRTTLAGIEFGRIDLIFLFSAVLMLAGAFYAATTLRGAGVATPADDGASPESVTTTG